MFGAKVDALSCEGARVMNYHDEATAELEFELERLRFKQRYRGERTSSNQQVIPAIKMIVGDWYVDELGIPTREITARD